MTKTISVKELRMNFPKIKKELEQGIKFVIIYRSKPIADLSPIQFYEKPFEDRITDMQYSFPKTMKEYLDNIDQYSLKSDKAGDKPFDAVKLIRKDRGYED